MVGWVVAALCRLVLWLGCGGEGFGSGVAFQGGEEERGLAVVAVRFVVFGFVGVVYARGVRRCVSTYCGDNGGGGTSHPWLGINMWLVLGTKSPRV